MRMRSRRGGGAGQQRTAVNGENTMDGLGKMGNDDTAQENTEDGGNVEKTNLRWILRRMLPHIVLLAAASLYTVGGGYAFYFMERHYRPPHVPSAFHPKTVHRRDTPPEQCSAQFQWGLVESAKRECVVLARNDSRWAEDRTRYCATLLSRLATCLRPESASEQTSAPDGSSTMSPEMVERMNQFDTRLRTGEWTPSTCTFLAFTVITTIGYGDIAPVTVWGRLFCIVYGLVGIPLALLAVADQGRFLTEFVLFLYRRMGKYLNWRRGKDPVPVTGQENDTMPALLLLGLFALYLVLGGLILTGYERHWSFVDAVYFLFVSSATVGFGDLLPSNQTWLPLTLLYIALGLALATTAIDICAEYLRRLHHFGTKLRNCANKLVYFGGKRLTIAELVRTVGIQLGVPEEKIESLVENFDAVVEQTIQERETNPTAREEPSGPQSSFTGPSRLHFIDSPCESDRRMSVWTNNAAI